MSGKCAFFTLYIRLKSFSGGTLRISRTNLNLKKEKRKKKKKKENKKCCITHEKMLEVEFVFPQREMRERREKVELTACFQTSSLWQHSCRTCTPVWPAPPCH